MVTATTPMNASAMMCFVGARCSLESAFKLGYGTAGKKFRLYGGTALLAALKR
jgi:hypothetical protein